MVGDRYPDVYYWMVKDKKLRFDKGQTEKVGHSLSVIFHYDLTTNLEQLPIYSSEHEQEHHIDLLPMRTPILS